MDKHTRAAQAQRVVVEGALEGLVNKAEVPKFMNDNFPFPYSESRAVGNRAFCERIYYAIEHSVLRMKIDKLPDADKFGEEPNSWDALSSERVAPGDICHSVWGLKQRLCELVDKAMNEPMTELLTQFIRDWINPFCVFWHSMFFHADGTINRDFAISGTEYWDNNALIVPIGHEPDSIDFSKDNAKDVKPTHIYALRSKAREVADEYFRRSKLPLPAKEAEEHLNESI